MCGQIPHGARIVLWRAAHTAATHHTPAMWQVITARRVLPRHAAAGGDGSPRLAAACRSTPQQVVI
eukprot:6627000-Prymnesium_polylepis.1